jgi:hypothetical protein
MRSNLLCSILVATLALSAALPTVAQSLVAPILDPFHGPKPEAAAQTGPSGIITTVAGDGYMGNDGNGGPATKAHLIAPEAVAVDSAGNLYIADTTGQVVRKVTVSNGTISAFAGTGDAGYSGDKGQATKAQLNQPSGLAVDSSGNVYIADAKNNVIRKVNASNGIITTVAGNGYGAQAGDEIKCGVRTDGIAATKSALCNPQGVAVDKEGNLFIADTENLVIRKVTAATGIITTVAGGNSYGLTGDGGLAVNAGLSDPAGLAVDDSGNLYIADTGHCLVRKVAASTGVITSIAGMTLTEITGIELCGLSGDYGPASSAELDEPRSVALDQSGNVFVADSANDVVRIIAASTGIIYTVAGSYVNEYNYLDNVMTGDPTWGYAGDNDPAGFAWLDWPMGVAVDGSGNLYIADANNSAIRKVTDAAVLPTTAPVLVPSTGTILSPASVTITSPVSGATIYYTTDGSVPTTKSTKYAAPISSVKTGIITAFSTSSGSPNSLAVVGRYFYIPTPVISPGTENITKATSVTIKEDNATATIYYTTDGSFPDSRTTAKVYSGAIGILATTTVSAQAVVTDAQGYNGWSATATATYTWKSAPAITSESYIESSSSQVLLIAEIDPYNEPTQYWFAYGSTATALTNTTSTTTGPTGFPIDYANAYVSGLTPNTTYYFQAVASNSEGTTRGAVVSFTTSFYVDPPVISPRSEIITKPVQPTITEDNPAATIYYTTDGSHPEDNPAAKQYMGPITISTTTTLTAQAKAVNEQLGTLWSGLSSATYTVPTVPSVTSESASENSGTQESLTAYINPNGASTQYWFAYGTSATALASTTAETLPLTGTSSQYAVGSLTGLTPNTTYYYQAVAANSLGTTKGTVQNFTTNYYAPVPAISPGSGNFTKAFTVNITQSNPSAAIYYTTDGSWVCDSSTTIRYNGPITVSTTTVLSAMSEVVNPQRGTLCSYPATATYIFPTAPTVSNESSAPYWETSAYVYAQINPNGETTQYWFAYGTSATALTSTTNQTGGLTGATSQNIYSYLNGLTANTTYYYQAVASNSLGTTKGTVQSFTTAQ